ncbi:hypothetical protein BDY24DRAFT_111946 [Mrakia frigida]|uniref:uncharacterized protein n=1 Tax=Mrakia frigida TaxID=29902 RepID=UPI003FCC2515
MLTSSLPPQQQQHLSSYPSIPTTTFDPTTTSSSPIGLGYGDLGRRTTPAGSGSPSASRFEERPSIFFSTRNDATTSVDPASQGSPSAVGGVERTSSKTTGGRISSFSTSPRSTIGGRILDP